MTKGSSLRNVYIDCETHLITPADQAPKIVCVAIADDTSSTLLPAAAGADAFLQVLRDPTARIVGAHIAYDIRCLIRHFADLGFDLHAEVFDAYRAGRISDILVREALFAIGNGTLGLYPDGRQLPGGRKRYSLEICTQIHCPTIVPKENDTYRLRYAEFDGVPIKDWPWEARQYPIDDVETTRAVWISQVERAAKSPYGDNMQFDAFQAYAAFCLDLGGSRGWQINPAKVAALKTRYEKLKEHPEVLQAVGVVDAAGKKNAKVVKRMLAQHHGCTLECSICTGWGFTATQEPRARGGGFKKPQLKSCKPCDGTGYYLEESLTLPRTSGGAKGVRGISATRDALNETDDPILTEFADYSSGDKILQTYVPILERAAEGGALVAKANVLLATGRVSFESIMQTFPRKAGARECAEARDGYVVISIDYAGIEMVAWAYVCKTLLGYSDLAEAINADADAHSIVGSLIAAVPLAEFLKHKKGKYEPIRTASKALNFGKPGGMGSPTFVLQKRKEDYTTKTKSGREYDGIRFCILVDGADACGTSKSFEWKGRPIEPVCTHCLEVVERITKTGWREAWSEADAYLKLIGEMAAKSDKATALTGLVRGGMNYTAMANFFFQSLAAQGAKQALCEISYECYCVPESPLYGSRPLVFAHDEILAELPEGKFREAAKRMEQIMVREMNKVIPGLLVKAEPAIMKTWSKKAEAVYDEKGELQIWHPKS